MDKDALGKVMAIIEEERGKLEKVMLSYARSKNHNMELQCRHRKDALTDLRERLRREFKEATR